MPLSLTISDCPRMTWGLPIKHIASCMGPQATIWRLKYSRFQSVCTFYRNCRFEKLKLESTQAADHKFTMLQGAYFCYFGSFLEESVSVTHNHRSYMLTAVKCYKYLKIICLNAPRNTIYFPMNSKPHSIEMHEEFVMYQLSLDIHRLRK